MTQEYKFNVKAFYLLLSVIQKSGIDLNNIDDDKFISSLIDGLVFTQDETIKLLSVVANKEIKEVEELSTDEFIDLVAGFVKSVNWEEIMGKLMKIVPETKQDQQAA